MEQAKELMYGLILMPAAIHQVVLEWDIVNKHKVGRLRRFSNVLQRVNHFCKEREKIQHFDPFTGMSKDRILWFLKRNRANFKKK